MVRDPCLYTRADPGLLHGDRHYRRKSRDAAVVATLCPLACWGPLVPPRDCWRAPDPACVLECLPRDSTADGVHPAVAALLHDVPAKHPDHWCCGANLGRRRLVGLRGPQLATALRGMAHDAYPRSTVGLVSPAFLLCPRADF